MTTKVKILQKRGIIFLAEIFTLLLNGKRDKSQSSVHMSSSSYDRQTPPLTQGSKPFEVENGEKLASKEQAS